MIVLSLESLIVTLPLFRHLIDRIARNLGYITPEAVCRRVKSAEEHALRSESLSQDEPKKASYANVESNAPGKDKHTSRVSQASDERRYFVSYHFSTGYGTNGFGNIQISRTHPVRSFEDIHGMAESIQKSLESRYDSEVSVVVLNWRLFENDFPDSGGKEPVPDEERVELRLVA